MEFIDSMGLLRGVFLAWNPGKGRFATFHTSTGILMSDEFVGFDLELNVINCYVPTLIGSTIGRE